MQESRRAGEQASRQTQKMKVLKSFIREEIYVERAEKRREMSIGELMTIVFRFEAF